MTQHALRLVAALAPIISWTLVAPASQAPTSVGADETPPVATATVAMAWSVKPDPLLTSSPSGAHGAEDTPSPTNVHPWRRLLKRETTPAVVAQANAIIRLHHTIGEEVGFTVRGEQFLARIEEHYHPPGGDKFPWGPHPGVSVFVARPPAAP